MVRSILPLIARGVVIKRRGKVLLGPIDMDIAEFGCTIVVGPNGAGKTTLLRALHGLERPAAGEVAWQVPLAQAQTQQAFVFQMPVMMRRTVHDSLAYPLRLKGVSKVTALSQAADWAARIGLANVLDQQAQQLSGGEKQKLALARALISKPQILFLDEPCANLDGRATREIEAILTEAQQNGTRILMATHDLGQARRLAQDIVVMIGGQVIETSPADQFFNGPVTPQGRAMLNGDIVE